MRVIVWILIGMIVWMGEAFQCRMGKMWGSRNAQSRRTTPIDPWVYGGLGGESTGQGGNGAGGSSGNPFNNNADDDGPQKRNTVVAATSQQDNLRQAAGKTSLNVVRDNNWAILGALGIVYTILGSAFGIGIYITRDMATKSDIKLVKRDIELVKSDIQLVRRDLVITVLVNAIVVVLVGKANNTGGTGVTLSKN